MIFIYCGFFLVLAGEVGFELFMLLFLLCVCDKLVLGVFSGEIYLGNTCFGGGKRNEDI
jgi:hypothetical protein